MFGYLILVITYLRNKILKKISQIKVEKDEK